MMPLGKPCFSRSFCNAPRCFFLKVAPNCASSESGKKTRIFRLFYMMKRPNQLYLEITAALQQPGAIITSDGKRFALHNLLQKNSYKALPNASQASSIVPAHHLAA